MLRHGPPGAAVTGAFALLAGQSRPGNEGAERARAAVSGSHSAVEGHVSLGWTGTAPPDRAWRCLLAGRLWDALDVAELLESDGAGALPLLRGRFALVAWRPGSGQALVAVDQLGAGAVFMSEHAGTLAAATEIRELLRVLPRRPAPDAAAVVGWITRGALARGQTHYEGVRRLPGGHVVEIEGAVWRLRRYWTARYKRPLLSRGEATEAVRSGIAAAVARRAGTARAPGVLLSGGLDSASVAAGAKLAGLPQLRAYSAVFPQHPTIDESGLIATVAAGLGLDSRTSAVEAGSMIAPGIEHLVTWGVPSVSPNLFVHRPLLQAAGEDGVDILLDGQGGDELFGCAAYLLADRLRRGRGLSAIALARRVPGVGAEPSNKVVRRLVREFGLKGMLPLGLHRAARRLRRAEHYAPPWLTPASARIAVETDPAWGWKALDGPRWWAQLADEVMMQRERMGAHDFLRRKISLTGLEGGHPLLDDLDLIELVLCLPPDVSFDAELDRPILRAAMAGLVPDAVRLRVEKSYFNALFDTCLERVDGKVVRELLTSPDAEVAAYVRREAVRSLLIEPPVERRPRSWGWAVWRLVGAECWLRAEADSAFPIRLLETLEASARAGTKS
jgi:asparagine synthase (glutamine-hydrolysing)